ncbi:hypothetical protein SISSUDRAFT_1133088 [Sistotremastrum suecicum HHB10207 ss-3]|uniref:Uncharacterized protein n=1 Tax=Sistotremastrum suecicum HHB10207 ss-3 TaxID=1314776 RepID=A0A165XUM2_9AGAM|nr:hypothetical protein SISSUDRAFT_1133088 [Sistotremastrum suecicum HHB10207 ss-3]
MVAPLAFATSVPQLTLTLSPDAIVPWENSPLDSFKRHQESGCKTLQFLKPQVRSALLSHLVSSPSAKIHPFIYLSNHYPSMHSLQVVIAARVTLTQAYVNNINPSTPAAAHYLFPMPAHAAAVIANDKWAGISKEVTSHVFVISAGAIPPTDIKIFVAYVWTLLKNDFLHQVRFALPTYCGQICEHAPAIMYADSSDSKGAEFFVIVNIKMSSTIFSASSLHHIR